MLTDIESLLLQKQKERESISASKYNSILYPEKPIVDCEEVIRPLIKKLIADHDQEVTIDRLSLEKLDPQYKDVIELLYFEGYTHSRAAKKLDIPIGTVKTRCRAAIEIIKKFT